MHQFGSRDGPPMTIPVDPQLSFRWNLAAAKQEHVRAMLNTGYAYDKGIGVEQNLESALEWYTKAAKKDDKYAQTNVGVFYENGIDLVEAPNITISGHIFKAMDWYQKSATHARYYIAFVAAQEFQQAMDGNPAPNLSYHDAISDVYMTFQVHN